MTTATPTLPRNVAAEFAALMAEQADLNRRCFDVLHTAFREQSADYADLVAKLAAFQAAVDRGRLVLDADPRPRVEITSTIEVRGPEANERGSTKLFDAAGAEIKLSDPAAWKPEAPLAVEVRGEPAPSEPAPAATVALSPSRPPKPDPTPVAPAAKSPRDLVLDLYASSTLEVSALAAQLRMPVQKVAGTIGGSRRWNEPRALAGDALRRGKPVAAPSPAVAPLAPAPRAPQRVAAKPVAPPEPLPPVKTPAEAKARADARARVLRHYGETGDYEAQIAQKLGLLRGWVAAFIYEARQEKDPRVMVGDGRRRTRERAN